MKVNIELELPEIKTVAAALKIVAEKNPLGLLVEPLFAKIIKEIKSAEEKKDGNV